MFTQTAQQKEHASQQAAEAEQRRQDAEAAKAEHDAAVPEGCFAPVFNGGGTIDVHIPAGVGHVCRICDPKWSELKEPGEAVVLATSQSNIRAHGKLIKKKGALIAAVEFSEADTLIVAPTTWILIGTVGTKTRQLARGRMRIIE